MEQNEKAYEKLEPVKKEYERMQMSEEQLNGMKQSIAKARKEKRMKKHRNVIKSVAAAAAVIVLFVVLPNTSADVAHAMSTIPVIGKLVDVVTFRDYQYESERHHADITVPELVANDIGATGETDEVYGETEAVMAGEENEVDNQVQENLKKTTEEINAEIQKITDQIVNEFEENKKDEEGYQDVLVKTEILNTTEEYFTLKLICYQGAGSGAEWDYFYTIDLNTGERLALADLFTEGADYITPISENIKEQMRSQMAEDEMVYYWVDEEDVPEWNFKAITDETSFYVNGDGNIVICFDEGDVAPMYMGCVEFVIPDETVAEIRR